MPLTAKGEKILANMEQEYGEKKGEEVFYASRNAGTVTGVDSVNDVFAKLDAILAGCDRLDARIDAISGTGRPKSQ